MKNKPDKDDIKPLRAHIDTVDRILLQLLNERAQCVNAINYIKRQLGLPIYVASREQDVLRNVTSANEGPLDSGAVQRVFERIINETRAHASIKRYENKQTRSR